MSQSQKIGFISLGCPKALVDSERILTQLKTEGYEIGADYDHADLVVINTCGFIDPAVEESLQTIEEALQNNGKVIVTGCLGGKESDLKQRYPELLAVSGAHDYEQVMMAVHQYAPADNNQVDGLVPPQGIKLTPKHYAYLKISEGCNHSCRFCIIPDLRGPLQSFKIDQVLQEAENLVNAGVKELLVVAQDSSAYGLDLKYPTGFYQGRPIKTRFYELCQELGRLGVWVRLHYVYPYPHVDQIIPLMAEGKILPYLDIPMQHANRDILQAMKRPAASEKMLQRIQSWREICPDISLRSTFIVGFPGESEAQFYELLDFLQEAQLDHVGAFAYSPVEGAKANKLKHQVDPDIKEHRRELFMLTQAKISRQKLAQRIGQTMEVIIDGEDQGYLIGRSKKDAPEIDSLTYIESNQSIKPGEIIQVEISDADEYDCYASIKQR